MEPRESIDLWLSELKPDYQESVKLEPDLPAASVLSNPTIQTDVVARDLALVKAECEQQEQSFAAAKAESDLSAPAISPPASQAVEKNLYSGSVDRDLAQIKAEYERGKQIVSAMKTAADSQVRSMFATPVIQVAENNLYGAVADSDLARIKAEYEERDRNTEVAKEVAKQEQQQAGQIAQQELQVKTRREKVRQAQVWLKKLDKNSDEGFWFDRFAYKYDCRVEAAIDYLAAVK